MGIMQPEEKRGGAGDNGVGAAEGQQGPDGCQGRQFAPIFDRIKPGLFGRGAQPAWRGICGEFKQVQHRHPAMGGGGVQAVLEPAAHVQIGQQQAAMLAGTRLRTCCARQQNTGSIGGNQFWARRDDGGQRIAHDAPEFLVAEQIAAQIAAQQFGVRLGWPLVHQGEKLRLPPQHGFGLRGGRGPDVIVRLPSELRRACLKCGTILLRHLTHPAPPGHFRQQRQMFRIAAEFIGGDFLATLEQRREAAQFQVAQVVGHIQNRAGFQQR